MEQQSCWLEPHMLVYKGERAWSERGGDTVSGEDHTTSATRFSAMVVGVGAAVVELVGGGVVVVAELAVRLMLKVIEWPALPTILGNHQGLCVVAVVDGVEREILSDFPALCC